MRVDLPAPFAPTRPMTPGSTATVSWSSAVTRREAFGQSLGSEDVMVRTLSTACREFLRQTNEFSLLHKGRNVSLLVRVVSVH